MAIALSLDAFSVALVLGVINKKKSNHLLFSIVVGILHFIMPCVGALTNSILFKNLFISGNKLLGITLMVLALSILIDLKNDKETFKNSNIIVLAFSVSIDSYFSGLGLKSTSNFSLIYFFVFSIFSCIIALTGCILGNYGKSKFGGKANYIAIIILLLLSVKYILFN